MENNLQTTFSELLTQLIQNDQIGIQFHIPKNSYHTLAYVTISIDELIISGFRLILSDFENSKGENITLTPPHIQSRTKAGNYYKVFFIDNLGLWHKLQDKVIEKYHQAKKEIYQPEGFELTKKQISELEKNFEGK